MSNPSLEYSWEDPRLIPLVTTQDFDIYTEDYDGMVFVHVNMKRWAPSVARSFAQTIGDAFPALKGPVLSAHFADDRQGRVHVKFLERAGFHQLGEADYHGVPAIIYAKVQ